MNADRLNIALNKLFAAHKSYIERAVDLYERNLDQQLAALTQATEKAEAELVKQLEVLTKQVGQ